jgi:2-polyprenyl-6-methoxyphenol hydroxylase-like FAD-dependent oxidoreductase
MSQSPRRRLQVAVVGDGIAGAAASLLLARAGHAVQRFEQAAEHSGAGLLLQPLGMSVLAAMGLLDAAIARGARIERLDAERRCGAPVMSLDFTRCEPSAFALGLQRAVLADLLRGAAADGGDIVPVRIVGADPQAGKLRDGDGGQYGPFDLVVAADGAGSALRTSLAIRSTETRYRWGAWLLLLDDPQHRYVGRLWQCHARRQQLAVWPVGTRAGSGVPRVNLSWRVEMATHAHPAHHHLDAFKQALVAHASCIEPLLAQVEDMQQVVCAGYRAIATARSVCGRVVLLGDAAHAMSPVLGQGASLALLDAWQLARSLAGSGDDVDAALARFTHVRGHHVRTYQRLSRWLTPLMQSSHALPAWLREQALPRWQRLPWVAEAMRRTACGTQLGWFSRLRDPLA